MWEEVKGAYQKSFELICGVPYTGLPIASCMSLDTDVSMVMKRKEAKDYGTKKMVEGIFQGGESCLIVEDIITSGASVLETIESLKQVDLKATEIVVLVDREQGGRKRLTDMNLSVSCVLNISFVMEVLEEKKLLSSDVVKSARKFIEDNQVWPPPPSSDPSPPKPLTYTERASLTANKISKQVFELMDRKKTNLCLSADTTDKQKLLDLIDQTGPHLCMLKTHIDTVDDFDADLVEKIGELAKKHDFIVFEDRKFADIGHTVSNQFRGGAHKIAGWADIINAHVISGPSIVSSLREVSLKENELNHGLLLIAQMSSEGSMCKGEYTTTTTKIAKENDDFVIGYICQEDLGDPKFLHCTPGVKLPPPGQEAPQGDGQGQQYTTPSTVINKGTDVMIVGRGIINFPGGPAEGAKVYREEGWKAYEKRCKA